MNILELSGHLDFDSKISYDITVIKKSDENNETTTMNQKILTLQRHLANMILYIVFTINCKYYILHI